MIFGLIEVISYDPSLDNGLGAAIFLVAFGVFLFVYDRLNQYTRILRKSCKKMLKKKRQAFSFNICFYRYCRRHKREISFLMSERLNKEGRQRRESVL